MTSKTRTGYVREIVTRNGGKVKKVYSDGPIWRQSQFDGAWYKASEYSIKLEVDMRNEDKADALRELRLFGVLAHDVKRAYLTRPYKGKTGGHLKIEFNHCYTDFKKMKK